VTFSARAGRTAVGRVEIYDATDRVVLNAQTFSAREWTNYSFDFEAPAREGHELVIRITHDQWAVAGAVLFVDDVEIRRVR
jgi:hypothetical protein